MNRLPEILLAAAQLIGSAQMFNRTMAGDAYAGCIGRGVCHASASHVRTVIRMILVWSGMVISMVNYRSKVWILVYFIADFSHNGKSNSQMIVKQAFESTDAKSRLTRHTVLWPHG